uniref:CTP_transf_like domain-containing protein n=1 Tax=Panagrellus redivivus TaxID=6233 RepID=A0A7E4W0Y7_PANRE
MRERAKLVTIGAFDPPTYAHLRMLERAKDFLEKNRNIQIVEGIMSIIPDVFRNKRTVANRGHRMKMLKWALKDSRWMRADDWQCCQTATPSFYDTLSAIDKFCNIDHDANRISTIFVCSAKLFEEIGIDETDYCNIDDLTNILNHFDTVVRQLHIVHDSAYSGPVKGSNVRDCLSRGESIKFCTDDNVISYIHEYGLYSCQAPPIPSRIRHNHNNEVTNQNILNTSHLITTNTSTTVCPNVPKEEKEGSLPLKFDNAIRGIDDCLKNYVDADSTTLMSKSCHAAVWTPFIDVLDDHGHPVRFPSPDDVIPRKRAEKLSALSADNLDKTERFTSKGISENTNRAFTSLISFTFEQHNLTCTPETTV